MGFGGRRCANETRLILMFLLTGSFFLVEIIVGYISNSMALVADSFHMLSDVAALVIAFIAVLIAPKKWSKSTFGWARAEVLGALINSVFLLALTFSIIVESLKRFYSLEPIENPMLVFIVGLVGLGINLIGLLLFAGHGHGHHGHSHGHSHSHGVSVSPGESGRVSERKHSSPISAEMPMRGANAYVLKEGADVMMADLSEDQCEQEYCDEEVDKNGPVRTVSMDPSYLANATTDKPMIVPSADMAVKKGRTDASDGKKKKKKEHNHDTNMNMQGVFLHILGDALGSVIVVISAAVVQWTNWEYRFYLDPSLSLVMALIIIRSTWPLLVESSMVLLQTVPTHIDLRGIEKKLLSIEGVRGVHEFHVWRLTGERIIASAHITFGSLADYMRMAGKVKKVFHDEGIHSTTIQPESLEALNGNLAWSPDKTCAVICPPDDNCEPNMCCPPPPEGKSDRGDAESNVQRRRSKRPDVEGLLSATVVDHNTLEASLNMKEGRRWRRRDAGSDREPTTEDDDDVDVDVDAGEQPGENQTGVNGPGADFCDKEEDGGYQRPLVGTDEQGTGVAIVSAENCDNSARDFIV